MAKTKFFHGRRIQAHVSMKSPKRTKDGERKVTILFRVPLNGDTVRSAPDAVKWAYDGVKTKGEDHVGLKNEINNINAEYFILPDAKRATMKTKALYLEKLAVKEIKTSKSDVAVVLTFQSEYDWDKVIWEWLGDVYGTDVFIEFDAAQATLLDIEEDGPEDPEPDEELPLEEDEEELEPVE